MLIYLLYPSTSTEPPIIPDLRKSPRLQFLDTGLINYFVNLQGYFYETGDLHSFYQGLLAEHVVGQELLAIDMNKPGKTRALRSFLNLPYVLAVQTKNSEIREIRAKKNERIDRKTTYSG